MAQLAEEALTDQRPWALGLQGHEYQDANGQTSSSFHMDISSGKLFSRVVLRVAHMPGA